MQGDAGIPRRLRSAAGAVVGDDLAGFGKFRFVGSLAPGFGQRFGFPLSHRRMIEDRLDPRLASTDVQPISPDAEGDRGEECVERSECTAGKPGTAEARQRFLEYLAQPGDVADQRRPGRAGMTRTPTFIVQSLRRAEKPPCISVTAHCAKARAASSCGHTPGWRSARYSAIPSESHTVRSPSTSAGTCPVGEKLRKASKLTGAANGSNWSTKAMSSAFISTHGRSDQLE